MRSCPGTHAEMRSHDIRVFRVTGLTGHRASAGWCQLVPAGPGGDGLAAFRAYGDPTFPPDLLLVGSAGG